MAGTKKGRGKGWYGDPEGHARAGQAGGEALKMSRGEAYFSEIGRIGGKMRGRNRKAGKKKRSS